MAKRIVYALEETGLTSVVIGMESTGVYGDNLLYFLREDGALGRFERKLYVLNPKQVSKFKEAYNDLPKNDPVDAFVVADSLRFGRIGVAVYMDDYRCKALQNLTRARFHAVQNQTRAPSGGRFPKKAKLFSERSSRGALSLSGVFQPESDKRSGLRRGGVHRGEGEEPFSSS
jgi:transposase